MIKKFKDKLIKPHTRELITNLEDYQLELKSRFIYLFSQLAELGEKPFLLILDDFEWNLEPQEGRYILKPEVAPILEVLVEAIQETGTEHRIIITCRYDFDLELLELFYKQGLEPLRKAELTKKLNRLEHFSSDNLSEDILNRALNLADGNPRLLEFLNNDILGREGTEDKLKELEQSPELWKDQIIHEELYQLIDKPLQQVLSYCLVYNLRVPKEALETVCDSLPDYQKQLQRGLDLGLIEMSPEVQEEERVYRVPRILSHIIPQIQLNKGSENYRNAHQILDKLWGNEKNRSEEQWQEIFRLLFADKHNPARFRQGFHKMLAVQYNEAADKAFEFKLRQVKDKLFYTYLHLEDYLRQGQWIEADKETTWILYQVMVSKGYEYWGEMLRNFPSEILNKIDQLWINYSRGHFGFSIQKHIWESISEGRPGITYQHTKWSEFCKQIGWVEKKRETNIDYINLPFTKNSKQGNLPALWTTRDEACGSYSKFDESYYPPSRKGGWSNQVAVGPWIEYNVGPRDLYIVERGCNADILFNNLPA